MLTKLKTRKLFKNYARAQNKTRILSSKRPTGLRIIFLRTTRQKKILGKRKLIFRLKFYLLRTKFYFKEIKLLKILRLMRKI